MYVSKKNCVNVTFFFNKAAETALLDSGATNNFIDRKTVKRLHIQTRNLPRPHILYNVNKTENKSGRITHYVDLKITRGMDVHVQRFYVADLGTNCFILGFPWLYEFNPEINWRNHTANGLPLHICTMTKTAGDTTAANLVRTATEMHSRLAWTHEWKDGDEIVINHTNFAQEWAIQANQQKNHDPIPEEYRRHKKVFSEAEAQRFPPSQDDDHAIKLKPNAPPILDCKIYPLNPTKTDALKKWIKEHLDKGYIQLSKSPYTAPFFFIKKKDGTLHPVQDYRALNAWTVRDVYPLPDINSLTRNLAGKCLFMKFDIRWGYHNVCIRDGDQWKAAFKTPEGLFEPMVMLFGQCNAPATFQHVMDRILRPLKLKYPYMIFVYMDDILIATLNNPTLHRQIVHNILNLLK